MSPRIVLVGPSGAGKTTVGALLARRLGLVFRDSDLDVEATTGMPIIDIFVEHGEGRFRELERAAVAAALAEHDGVLAVGGGAVLDAETRQRLGGHHVVFLDVGITDAARRIGFNRDRPLLLGNPRKRWVTLMQARRPFYEEVAEATVRTDGVEPAEVVDRIVEALETS